MTWSVLERREVGGIKGAAGALWVVALLYPGGMAELAEPHGHVLDSYGGTLLTGLTRNHHVAFAIGTIRRRQIHAEIL
jgi:hypothetical protein